MNELITKQKQTHRHRTQTYGYQGEMGGLNEEYEYRINSYISSVQSLSRVRLFATLWTAARQTSLSFTISWSLLKLMSFELMIPSNYLILCHPLLRPSSFPSIRVFSSESLLHTRWHTLCLKSKAVEPCHMR